MDFATKVLTTRNNETQIFSVGQAGYIIKSKSGQLLAIDLYLSECVERLEGHIGFKRLLPKILNPFDIVFDCVIATHEHWDHFDVDAIPQMMSNNHTKLFASVDCEALIKNAGMTNNNTTYVKPGDSAVCGDFKLDFINCDHGKGAPDAVGVIVTVDGKRILEVGDTCLRLDRVDEYLSKGTIDVFIAPVNGEFGNLNERECAELADAIKPKLIIPCHYGMFASHKGNPGLFYDIMTTDFPDNKFCFLQMGEGITL